MSRPDRDAMILEFLEIYRSLDPIKKLLTEEILGIFASNHDLSREELMAWGHAKLAEYQRSGGSVH